MTSLPFYTAAGYKKIAFPEEPASRPKYIHDSDMVSIINKINAKVALVSGETISKFCEVKVLDDALQTLQDVHDSKKTLPFSSANF